MEPGAGRRRSEATARQGHRSPTGGVDDFQPRAPRLTLGRQHRGRLDTFGPFRAGGHWQRCQAMFRYLLVLPDDEPNDPLSWLTAVPNWSVGETIVLGDCE